MPVWVKINEQMIRFIRFNKLILSILTYTVVSNSCNNTPTDMPPSAEKKKYNRIIHGDTATDHYYWLRERESEEVAAYLNAENEFLKSKLLHTEALQRRLLDEITERMNPDDQSVPYFENNYWHYSRYAAGKEHPVYCRKVRPDAAEEVLIDVNKNAEGLPFYEIGDYSLSPDNNILAFSEDTLGRRLYAIRLRNLKTGAFYPETIQNTDGNIVWANDNKTIFYTRKDVETLREYQILKHTVGKSPETDVVVYEETDDAFNSYAYKSKSDKYIFIGSYSSESTEYSFIPADKPDTAPKIFAKRQKNLEYSVEHANGNTFFVLHNHRAKNFKLSTALEGKTDLKSWTDFVPYDSTLFLEDFEIFKNHVVIKERKSGLIKLRVVSVKDKIQYYADLGEEVYEAWISDNYEPDSEVLRYGYSSLTTPASVIDYDLKTKQKVILKQQFAGKTFSSANYETKRLYATAADGKQIPISILHKKGLTFDGKNPMLVYGYGSYGYSLDVHFQSSLISLIDRGFVYAIAHVRGGQELGREWYDEGKLLKKQNTFTDFIACTDYLCAQGYSKPELTFAQGGSAGGLLVGAVSNIAPEKYRGIIAQVPFVDVVTTMLDESIPLTTGEFEEWGNPKNKTYYRYMLSYSPYDNVSAKPYPAMFVTGGLHDSQVQYWEPAKWVAKLRDYNTSTNPIYLYTEMDAGHGGASGRYEQYKETALIYAFMLDLLGIN